MLHSEQDGGSQTLPHLTGAPRLFRNSITVALDQQSAKVQHGLRFSALGTGALTRMLAQVHWLACAVAHCQGLI